MPNLERKAKAKHEVLNFLKLFLSSLLSGILIGLAAFAYVKLASMDGNEPQVFTKVIASFIFTIGVVCISFLGLCLFTGKIGFVGKFNARGIPAFVIYFIGNALGALLIGLIANLLPGDPGGYIESAVIDARTYVDSFDILEFFFSGFFCGMLVFMGIFFFRRYENPAVKLILLVLPIFLFVVLDLQHIIANFFYLTYFNAWNFNVLINIALITLGNSLGAIATCQLFRLLQIIKKDKVEEPKEKESEETSKDS